MLLSVFSQQPAPDSVGLLSASAAVLTGSIVRVDCHLQMPTNSQYRHRHRHHHHPRHQHHHRLRHHRHRHHHRHRSHRHHSKLSKQQ